MKAKMRRIAHYADPARKVHMSDEECCGNCRRYIPNTFGFLTTAQHIASGHIYKDGNDPERPLQYIRFCPWCGVEFEPEWWKNREIEGLTPPDHMKDNGMHVGDQHEFRGFTPAGHALGSTDKDYLCWCGPTRKRTPEGCIIRHKNKPPPKQWAITWAELPASDKEQNG